MKKNILKQGNFPPMPAIHTRPILTKDKVQQIFAMKMKSYASCVHVKADSVISTAVKFGVSEKAIRDVWSGRTWCDITGMPRNPNRRLSAGRPKGAKDKKPRKPKCKKIQVLTSLEVFQMNSIDDHLFIWARSSFVWGLLFIDDSIPGLE